MMQMKSLKLVALIWLSTFVAVSLTASPSQAEKRRPFFLRNGLNAPIPKGWPDLPDPFDGPGGAICLPNALSEEVALRLKALEVYPIACQEVIEANRKYEQTQKGIALSACGETCEVQKAAIKASSWSWWEMGLMVVGGTALGFTSGYVYHALK